MDQMQALQLSRHILGTAMLVSAPLLLTVAVLGLGISLLQALTQIQEQSLPVLIKLGAAIMIVLMAGPWMTTELLDVLVQVLQQLPRVAGH